jgi:hypothetical protein
VGTGPTKPIGRTTTAPQTIGLVLGQNVLFVWISGADDLIPFRPLFVIRQRYAGSIIFWHLFTLVLTLPAEEFVFFPFFRYVAGMVRTEIQTAVLTDNHA